MIINRWFNDKIHKIKFFFHTHVPHPAVHPQHILMSSIAVWVYFQRHSIHMGISTHILWIINVSILFSGSGLCLFSIYHIMSSHISVKVAHFFKIATYYVPSCMDSTVIENGYESTFLYQTTGPKGGRGNLGRKDLMCVLKYMNTLWNGSHLALAKNTSDENHNCPNKNKK